MAASVQLIASPARAPRATWRSVLAFVILTYALSWSIWAGGWLLAGRPEAIGDASMILAVYAGSFAPGIIAGLLAAREGKQTFLTWLGGFVRFRCGWRAYVVALLPLPIAFAALTWLLGYTPQVKQGGLPAIYFYLTLFPVSIFNGAASAIMGAGPLGEEGGWRGYLLPKLLDRMSELQASILIGVIWALWHLPIMAMFIDWREGASLVFYLPTYIIGLVALSYIFTVVWRLGRGSLVPCIWLHGLVNAIGGLAFNHRAWNSAWSQEASVSHSLIVFWIVALGLWATHRFTKCSRTDGVLTERLRHRATSVDRLVAARMPLDRGHYAALPPHP